MPSYRSLYLARKQQQLCGPINYRDFRETGPFDPLQNLQVETIKGNTAQDSFKWYQTWTYPKMHLQRWKHYLNSSFITTMTTAIAKYPTLVSRAWSAMNRTQTRSAGTSGLFFNHSYMNSNLMCFTLSTLHSSSVKDNWYHLLVGCWKGSKAPPSQLTPPPPHPPSNVLETNKLPRERFFLKKD